MIGHAPPSAGLLGQDLERRSPRVAIVAPTFNHAAPLADVLTRLEPHGLPVIAIDDGSTDGTAAVLADWVKGGRPGTRLLITFPENRGKAAALRAGFAEASRRGFTHAATIDTDGQHDPADLTGLIRACTAQPAALIIGARRREGSDAPKRSRVGRAISNRLIALECGARVDDSQSGMRVYPLERMNVLNGRAQRYGFETEVVTRAGWHGVPVVEVPIRCIYNVAGGRITHFRVGGDTLRSVGMHAKLLLQALKPGPMYSGEGDGPATGRIPRRLLRWFSLFRLVRMARGDAALRERLAASVGWGFVVATLPIYGVKTLVCLWLAGKFRLHPVAVVGTSSLSTPPIGFLFVAASIWTGSLLLHGRAIDLNAVSMKQGATWSGMNTLLAEWLVGSVPAAAVLGLLAYAAMRLVLIGGARTDQAARSAAPLTPPVK